jgi:hypothetical protein
MSKQVIALSVCVPVPMFRLKFPIAYYATGKAVVGVLWGSWELVNYRAEKYDDEFKVIMDNAERCQI